VTRYLFRCPNPACRHAWGFDYEERAKYQHPARAEQRGEHTFQIEPGADQRGGCPKCGAKKCSASRVVGVYSHAVRCDRRCWESVTGRCTCQCGGAHHGQAHFAPACNEPEKT
jgi:hypothetical protein